MGNERPCVRRVCSGWVGALQKVVGDVCALFSWRGQKVEPRWQGEWLPAHLKTLFPTGWGKQSIPPSQHTRTPQHAIKYTQPPRDNTHAAHAAKHIKRRARGSSKKTQSLKSLDTNNCPSFSIRRSCQKQKGANGNVLPEAPPHPLLTNDDEDDEEEDVRHRASIGIHLRARRAAGDVRSGINAIK
jgi:hypothetical protein